MTGNGELQNMRLQNIAHARLSKQENILLLLACQARASKQNFLVLAAWKKVFLYFIVMGSTKIGYLDPKIEFSSKKYTNTRFLVSGHDQTQALPPHPTVCSAN